MSDNVVKDMCVSIMSTGEVNSSFGKILHIYRI